MFNESNELANEAVFGLTEQDYNERADMFDDMDDDFDPEFDNVDDFDDDDYRDDVDESMDGDFDSGMASAGYGTDEDYGYYGNDMSEYDNDCDLGGEY